jgi:hypothetical protein
MKSHRADPPHPTPEPHHPRLSQISFSPIFRMAELRAEREKGEALMAGVILGRQHPEMDAAEILARWKGDAE